MIPISTVDFFTQSAFTDFYVQFQWNQNRSTETMKNLDNTNRMRLAI